MKSFMQMTGSMTMASMYTIQGSDHVIIRTKGGPNKYQIKTKPQFEKVRCNNNEWSWCTKMGSQIRWSFQNMNRMEDYPVTGGCDTAALHRHRVWKARLWKYYRTGEICRHRKNCEGGIKNL
jgi:hypothetical protein